MVLMVYTYEPEATLSFLLVLRVRKKSEEASLSGRHE